MFRCCGKKHRRKFAEQSVKDRTQSIRLTTHHNSLRAPAFSLASVWETYSYWTELRASDSPLTTTLWELLPSHWLLYERHIPIGQNSEHQTHHYPQLSENSCFLIGFCVRETYSYWTELRASDSLLTTTLWELLLSHWLLCERHVAIGQNSERHDSLLTTTLWGLLLSHWLLCKRHVSIGQNSERQTHHYPQLSEDSSLLICFCMRIPFSLVWALLIGCSTRATPNKSKWIKI